MLPFLRLLFICRWHKPAATAIVSFVTFKIYVSMCPTIIHHYSTFHFVILECFYLVSSRYHFCLSRSFEFIHTCSECFFYITGSLYTEHQDPLPPERQKLSDLPLHVTYDAQLFGPSFVTHRVSFYDDLQQRVAQLILCLLNVYNNIGNRS